MDNIYLYKVATGTNEAHLCKIGRSKTTKLRLAQHTRTPYYIFPPYLNFETNEPIYMAFSVQDRSNADKIIAELFSSCKLTGLEIYDIDYDEAIGKLIGHKCLTLAKGDGYTDTSSLQQENTDKPVPGIRKEEFETLVSKIINSKNGSKISTLNEILRPLPLPEWLRNNGNYIIIGNQFLSLNYNRAGRGQILERLKEIIES